MKFIDPHLHLFDLSMGEYLWLKPESAPFWSDKKVIQRNFSEQDINLTGHLALDGFVHIEAGFDNNKPWREIHWLESSCQSTFKSVACIDLTLSNTAFKQQVEELLSYQSVVGCRHILDEQANDILNHPNTQTNLKTLAQHQLSFDLQMPLSNLQAINSLTAILNEIPDLLVIINHAGFPPCVSNNSQNNLSQNNLNQNNISPSNSGSKNSSPNIKSKGQTEYEQWLQGLQQLSQFKQCAIKCSGWEMQTRNYNQQWCETIIEQCINTFGENRVMLGSNFPLCLFSKNYQDIWHFYASLSITNKEQLEKLCLKNAKHWYKFQL